MKKKTAILLICAVCAASVAVGVAAKGAFRENAKRPEGKSVDTSRFITEDRARTVSLERAGLKASDVARVKTELDFDDGVWKYEVEFKHGGFEYDVDVDAEKGSVLKFEKEYDD